jgi:hypothetical protein
MSFILTSGGKCGRPREQLLLLVRYLGVERQTAASRALRLRFALRDSHRRKFRRCSAGICQNKQYKLKRMILLDSLLCLDNVTLSTLGD